MSRCRGKDATSHFLIYRGNRRQYAHIPQAVFYFLCPVYVRNPLFQFKRTLRPPSSPPFSQASRTAYRPRIRVLPSLTTTVSLLSSISRTRPYNSTSTQQGRLPEVKRREAKNLVSGLGSSPLIEGKKTGDCAASRG
ncbi:hypothetical protein SISSUDRAFT_218704 [Sistotremastrum suecicum HHB10207 ss-3]|uniref:Uncharacterized protein n=1 Tax=Sistotremastrum suecicum HHB10207 ss-3 TaxID=1314776 RepID=A0A166A6T7_9AGAM|nr:hypothetical protein SISSUDRAFT_218704 [Sistotremastrum suecicum HHB10207 ss-3]